TGSPRRSASVRTTSGRMRQRAVEVRDTPPTLTARTASDPTLVAVRRVAVTALLVLLAAGCSDRGRAAVPAPTTTAPAPPATTAPPDTPPTGPPDPSTTA